MVKRLSQPSEVAVSWPWKWSSRLLPLHLLDEGAGLALLSKAPYFQVFPKGWGAGLSELNKIFELNLPLPMPKIKITWLEEKKDGHLPYQEGTFWVPQSEHLPEEIRDAHFRFIPPTSPDKKLCLLLAGWGEHGYNLRMRLARALYEAGIGTLLLENPFHGRRIVPGRAGTPVLTVAESGYLVHAAVYEGRALLRYFNDQGFAVGVSGFSMGGAMAGMIAVSHPHPLPTALLAAPYSPEVGMLGGLLRRGINWKQLSTLKDPEEKLRKLFRQVSLLGLDPPMKGSRIIMMGARNDRIVRAKFIEEFHRHWSHSELRWRPGGHISLWLFEVDAMSATIIDSFKK